MSEALALRVKNKDLQKETTYISLTIIEGRNHIVKNLFKELGYLVDKLTPLNEVFYGKIIIMQQQLSTMGMDTTTALNAAQGKIYGQLVQQSTLCAFIHAYKIYAIAIIILIPFIFILKKFEPEKNK